ncbi:MAG: hypothetical protein R3E66_23710 [bacterium]
MTIHPDAPASRYYQRHHGVWAGDYRFSIISWPVFWSARLGLINRITLLNLALASRFGIRVHMRTSLDASHVGRGEVVHTTVIGKFGIAFYASREVFTLNPDGVSMALVRVQRLWPFSFCPLPQDTGWGSVSPDANGATYDWLWYDRRMTQTTDADPEGLRLNQVSDWSSATVLLRRIGEDPTTS